MMYMELCYNMIVLRNKILHDSHTNEVPHDKDTIYTLKNKNINDKKTDN